MAGGGAMLMDGYIGGELGEGLGEVIYENVK